MLKKIKQLIAIGAGKGGVGKSTVTCHLALALANMGYEVGVLDADVYGPSIDLMLPFDVPPSEQDGYLIPAKKDGIKLMSVAYFKQTAAIVRAPIANETIERFLFGTNWGALDYLLVDFPPGTGDVQLTLLQQANFAGALLVTTPQEVALLDVRKAHDCFARLHVPILGLVENMSYFEMGGERVFPLGEGGGERLCRELDCQLIGKVPLEPRLSLCGDQGESLFNIGVDTQAGENFKCIAKKLDLVFEKQEGLEHFELVWKKNFSMIETSLAPISSQKFARIARLFQAGPKEFVIEWTDGGVSRYDLAKLQSQCPCARCQSQGKKSIDEVGAIKIFSIGRFGLKIEFDAGCKAGIFSFAHLRHSYH